MSTEPAVEFRSPKRALARSFRLSRDRWKAKAGQRRQENRALKVRLRDLETSRDLWKQKATHLQAQLDLLQASLKAPERASSLQTVEDSPPVGDLHAPNPVAATVPTPTSMPALSPLPPPSSTDEAPLEKKAPRARHHASV
jgi:hypothetical protein